jgi:hypothetical protein
MQRVIAAETQPDMHVVLEWIIDPVETEGAIKRSALLEVAHLESGMVEGDRLSRTTRSRHEPENESGEEQTVPDWHQDLLAVQQE